MNILSIHNTYQIRGGEDESRESEEKLLREMGQQVDVYEETNHRLKSLNPMQMVAKTIWSTESYQIVKERLQRSPYDLVHVQNSFPLISPSVYYAAQSAGVPVVQTLRNYRLLCPNALFFREGKVCEDCLGQMIPIAGIAKGCYRGSRSATAVVGTMLTVHRLMKTWMNQVDLYIALTEFARDKFIAGGFPAEKIVVKPNFVYPDPGVGQGEGNYALYVGRLSVEKGLDTLLQAWEKLEGRMPLKIVGEGPLEPQVQAAIAKIPNIELLGRRSIPEVYALMGAAQFVVFPSKWYETFGRVAVEAFAKGTPVIAAKIGAIAELVAHDQTGLHFDPDSAADLADKVAWAMSHPEALAQMRKTARAEYEAKYTAQKNYRRLMEIYAQARQTSKAHETRSFQPRTAYKLPG
ncbi:MAG: glycosyltransferase family 4 protein [Oculatellaceae cyanobacterium Prado106]|jgi:glycosyltransferase involved in cell wall biosynthesis|nr:glycosyltransferase family 4 protein [Oculatellaceae cyanobacterium Prado106]